MSFYRYPGGKAKLKDVITRQIIPHLENSALEYREPFWGGGSIGMEIVTHIKNLWINDKDPGISALWLAVIHDPEQLKEQIRNFQPTVQDFDQFKEDLLTGNQENLGFKKLVIHQISYSGLGTKSGGPLGGRKQESNYKIDCRWSPEYLCKKIDKIHNLLKNINTKCTSLDFQDVILDPSPAFIYLDPPYYIKGNELYQHGFSQENHETLATLLQETSHKWLLSYDDCPQVRELYAWANIQEINVNYTITTSRNKPELLITSENEANLAPGKAERILASENEANLSPRKST